MFVERPESEIVAIEIVEKSANAKREQFLRSAFFRRQRVVIDAPERPDKSIEDVRGRRDDVLLKPEVAGFVGEGYASFFDGTLETYEGGARGVEVT